MAIQEVEQIDYLAEAQDRLTSQFQDKEIVNLYLELLIWQQYELQQVFTDLIQKRSIDTATGATLDLLGEIVGQPRELIDADLIEYFAFNGYPLAASYGDLNNSSLGGQYWDLNKSLAGNVLLSDEQYRLFIKAKIIKNTTRATPNEFLNFIKFVFGAPASLILAEGGAEFTILVGKELSAFEQVLLTYVSSSSGYSSYFVPKPAGVRINFGLFPSTDFFAFQGISGAKGYGDLVIGSDLIYDGTFVYDGTEVIPTDFYITGGGEWASLL